MSQSSTKKSKFSYKNSNKGKMFRKLFNCHWKKKKTNRSSKRKRNCTTEKESVNQSPTCLNINIMKSTENQCATASNNYQDAIHSETGNNKTNKTLIEHETACSSKKKKTTIYIH